MALYNGIDTVAYVCGGWYTKTYVTSTGGGNIASLLVSYGMLEDAPLPPDGGLLNTIFQIGMSGIRFVSGLFEI